MSKLAAEQQAKIVRRYLEDGVSGETLAKEYGVWKNAVYSLLRRAGIVKERGWHHKGLQDARRCRLCGQEKPIAQFAKVSTREGAASRSYECKPCVATQHRELGWSLKTNTGLSLGQYRELLEAQGGGCAVCGNPPKRIRLSVDHDHVTGVIRGLLCHGCNTKLAGFDDPVQRQKLEAYIASPPAAGRGWQFKNRRTA